MTVKQARFAADVADGVPRAAAHRKHYKTNAPPDAPEPHRQAQRRKAAEIAKLPNVAAEIRRLTWLSCPPADDLRGMREQAIGVLADLSRGARSEEVRLKSALALYRIAETTRAASAPHATTQEQDKLLDTLRHLYRTIQGTERPTDLDPASPGLTVFDASVPDPLPNLPVVRDEDVPIDITLADQPASPPTESC